MKKILLVDDEFLARLGLHSIIDWNAHGYEIIGEAENGREALSLALIHQPDIIISDIQMPLMNGIELIESAKQENLKSKFVMLSSYDNFSLVKGALQAGAEDYLLKLDMEPDELLSILKRISIKIDKQRIDKQTEQASSLLLQKKRLELGKVMLKGALDGKIYLKKQLTELFHDFDLCIHPNCLVVIVFRVLNFSKLSNEAIKFWKQHLENEAQSTSAITVIENDESDFICVCSFSDQLSADTIESKLSHFYKSIIFTAKQSFNIDASAGISKKHVGVDSLRKSFLEASQAVSMTETRSFRKFEELQTLDFNDCVSDLDSYLSNIADHIKDNDCENILSDFDELIAYLKQNNSLSPLALQGGSHTLHYLVNDFVKQSGIENTPEWEAIQSNWSIGDPIEKNDEYIDWIMQLKGIFSDVFQNHHEKNYIILKAKRYVTSHVSQVITLKDVSGHLGLSPSYFSRLFRKKTQQCFVDYVREQKVQTAQNFIKTTNKKMYQIANLVGYENVQYFSRVFKQTTGMTPIAYRDGEHK
ncbi:response regulator [Marinomonas sp. 15G1-11]|uniref:Response regulator n=1 Tax=Marinomonas phaeophyticola TaxID=3004091 RepID=A0ABT4JPU1_9GAMM|nr:response regulator [Marinomonas sp. 15G1-11]MCZ2720400.1 response regulator [Marinomonas sp. 15G1-11]